MKALTVLFLSLATAAVPLRADVSLLVAEPFGKFGFFSPTGHASIYLSNICAETPTQLRLCRTGESGVVISRYHRVGGFDWIAIPLLPYLYAVERPEQVPPSVDPADIALLRDQYRRLHLRKLAPDGPDGGVPTGDWVQLVGSAYDRSIYGFTLPTTPELDQALVDKLNDRRNRQRFHLLYRNCADFARNIFNHYYPRALRRSIFADAGITTPKQAAKSLVRYSRKHKLQLAHFQVQQVPGGPRSTRIRGVSESLVKSKKYIAPLLLLQPWAAATAGVVYVTSGRFDLGRFEYAVCEPAALGRCTTGTPRTGQLGLASSGGAASGSANSGDR